LAGSERKNPFKNIPQLASPQQAQTDDDYCHRDSNGPVYPLTEVHIPHIICIHAENASYCAQGEENNSDDGERIDSLLLAIFGCIYFIAVLLMC
jgi:hypothetical protein